MQVQFVNMVPDKNNMVTENSTECAGKKFHGTSDFPCVDLLCVECGWTGHFTDGSTDHFFNHRCRLVSQMMSTTF